MASWLPPRTGPAYIILEGIPLSAKVGEEGLKALAGDCSVEVVNIYYADARQPGTAVFTFQDVRGELPPEQQ